MAVRLDLAGDMHIGMLPDRVLGIDIRERCWANMARAMREESEWFPPAGLPADLAREHLDAACRQGRLREGVLAVVGLLVAALDEAADKAKGDDT